MRYLMRLNAEMGTARKADVNGYYVGGKTGTAEKVVNGRYAKKRVLTTFTAIIPADKPQYLLLIMLDEPQPLKETYGFITSGWNAVPTAGNVIARIAPLLGIEPRFDLPPPDRLILAASEQRSRAYRHVSQSPTSACRGFMRAAPTGAYEASRPLQRRGKIARYRSAGRWRPRVTRARRRQPQGQDRAICFFAAGRQQGRRRALRRRTRSRRRRRDRRPIIRRNASAVPFVATSESAPRAGAGGGALLCRAARDDRGRHRHQRQDLGRGLHPPDLGSGSATPRPASAPSASSRRRRTVYGSLTTPDPVALHQRLDELAREGVTHLAIEASSHGLDQHRLDGVRLAAGGFTNLTRDHLDYHPTIEAYLAAKLRLFERRCCRTAAPR